MTSQRSLQRPWPTFFNTLVSWIITVDNRGIYIRVNIRFIQSAYDFYGEQ